MRKIKFRGKHDGKWLYGYLDCNFKGAYTINEENKPYRMAVDEETVGQYTGLTDYKGRKIYEGDILHVDDTTCLTGYVKYGLHNGQRGSSEIGFYVDWGEEADYIRPDLGYFLAKKTLRVIGNIYDNPEILRLAR